MQDIHYAQFLANTLYGVDLLPDDFEEMALVAFKLIGNKRTQILSTCAEVSCNGIVQLPCDCSQIEAITYFFEDWNRVTNKEWFGDLQSQFTEHWIEGMKRANSPYYVPGKFVEYTQISDDQIQIKDPLDTKVYILYKSEQLDSNGLPWVTDTEAIAIATFIGYTQKFKEGILTNNGDTIKLSQMLQAEWNRRCDAARIQDNLSQNDMDAILNVKVSWDRKQYGKSYKPIR